MIKHLRWPIVILSAFFDKNKNIRLYILNHVII